MRFARSTVKERERKFVAQYLKNGCNATQAVIDCGLTSNRKSAHVIGHRLLRNVNVSIEIERNLSKEEMKAQDIIKRLSEIAQTDAKFSGADVVKANEILAKARKMLTDRVESDVKVESVDPIEAYTNAYMKADPRATREEAEARAKRVFAALEPSKQDVVDGGEQ